MRTTHAPVWRPRQHGQTLMEQLILVAQMFGLPILIMAAVFWIGTKAIDHCLDLFFGE